MVLMEIFAKVLLAIATRCHEPDFSFHGIEAGRPKEGNLDSLRPDKEYAQPAESIVDARNGRYTRALEYQPGAGSSTFRI